MSRMVTTTSFTSTAATLSVCLRLNARSWRVRIGARFEALRISIEIVTDRFVGADLVEDHLGVSDDRGQQVVEVVRDAAGQTADALELLRLPEPGLEGVALFCELAHASPSRGVHVRAPEPGASGVPLTRKSDAPAFSDVTAVSSPTVPDTMMNGISPGTPGGSPGLQAR